MTKDEILRIKEHIEIHARREPQACKITEILWKAVDELEHTAELKEKKEEIEIMMSFCKTCKKMHIDQLTKAKELIKKMSYEYQRLCLIKKETLTKAEQFLKEVDK